MICVVQYGWSLVRRSRSHRLLKDYQCQLEGLEHDLANLRVEREQIQTENRLLQELLTESDPPSVTRRLLGCFAGEGGRGFAAFVVAEAPIRILAAAGLSRTAQAGLHLDPSLLDCLSGNKVLTIERAQAERTGLWSSLSESDRQQVDDALFLIRVPGRRNTPQTVLISTSLFPNSAPPDRQHRMSLRVIEAVARQIQQCSQTIAHDEELKLAREILELRSVLDARLRDEPAMLEEFLARLLAITAFDRVGILMRRATTTGLHRISVAQAHGFQASPMWRDDELRLAESRLEHPGLHLHDGGREDHGAGAAAMDAASFGQAVTAGLRCEGENLGILCLTRRQLEPIAPAEIELVQWATDFLVDAIVRATDQALMEDRAHHDGLTGLANRATFDHYLKLSVSRDGQAAATCGLILCDIDHFKRVNDEYGHQAGDEALRVVAAIVRDECASHLRGTDEPLAARYGGEELAVVLPGVNLAVAVRLAERIRLAVREATVTWKGTSFRVTVSSGVAITGAGDGDPAAIIADADQALYQAKHAGRDCVRPTIAAHPTLAIE
ncbi:MAG: GGDEF domain-containing protein [Planctomycetaceae bacterium]